MSVGEYIAIRYLCFFIFVAFISRKAAHSSFSMCVSTYRVYMSGCVGVCVALCVCVCLCV